MAVFFLETAEQTVSADGQGGLMLWTAVLFLVGFYLGIIIMCVLFMSRDDDDNDDNGSGKNRR